MIGGWSGNQWGTFTQGATIAGGGDPSTSDGPQPNSIDADYGSIGGGVGNAINSSGTYGVITGGHANFVKDTYGAIGGGRDNEAGLLGTVGGGDANRADEYATVGGGIDNTAVGSHSAIGGGENNTAQAYWSTIAGGENHDIDDDASHATIGGGDTNDIGSNGNNATISGGVRNESNGTGATIPGGYENVADGFASFAAGIEAHTLHDKTFVWNAGTVDTDSLETTGPDQFLIGAPGGVAIGTNTPAASLTVAGSSAAQLGGPNLSLLGTSTNQLESGRVRFLEWGHLSYRGAFIHYNGSDNNLYIGVHDSDDLVRTSDNNVITIERGSGDVGIRNTDPAYALQIGTGPASGNGAYLSDEGVWTNGSSRTFKHNFRDVDRMELLEKLSGLNVMRWNYRSDTGADHIGPVAEEFFETFGLGENDRYIGTVDADGVSLAAIQGLYDLVQQQQAVIRSLTERVRTLEAERDL
jgi:hypothetical protein